MSSSPRTAAPSKQRLQKEAHAFMALRDGWLELQAESNRAAWSYFDAEARPGVRQIIRALLDERLRFIDVAEVAERTKSAFPGIQMSEEISSDPEAAGLLRKARRQAREGNLRWVKPEDLDTR
jgi:hypothetical protein